MRHEWLQEVDVSCHKSMKMHRGEASLGIESLWVFFLHLALLWWTP